MSKMDEPTVPEKAFMAALDQLETIAKGLTLDGEGIASSQDADAEDLRKSQIDDDVLLKSDDGDGDDDTDEDEDEDMEKSGGDSFAQELADGSENIQKALEVSDFLSDLVDRVGTAIDGIRKANDARFEAIEKSLSTIAEGNQSVALAMSETMRKSYQAVAEKTDIQTEELRKSFETLNGELARVPAHGRKSKTTILAKSFDADNGGEEMTKDEILKSMTDLFEKGEPGITSMDILRFESGGSISPHVKAKLGLK